MAASASWRGNRRCSDRGDGGECIGVMANCRFRSGDVPRIAHPRCSVLSVFNNQDFARESLCASGDRKRFQEFVLVSEVRVAFDAGGRHIDAGERGYFEGGGAYRIAVVIEPDLDVTVTSDLGKY